jgi:hypothetical protein
MARMYRLGFRQTDIERDDADRQTSGLVGLVLALVLVVAGLYLVKHLHAVSAIENCLMMGRSNCDVMVSINH